MCQQSRESVCAWHNYGSSLSLSNQGWMQIANFLVCGLLTLGFAIGLRQVFQTGRGSVWGPILLGIFGLALIVAGLFVTDPGLGYPPGTHGSGPQTLHGTIHGVAGLVTFSSLALASFVMARRFAGDPNWKGWAVLVGHLVDAGGDRKDEDIVLPWLDLYTVGIANPEPFLGNLGYFVPALADRVLVVENIAFHLQIRSSLDPDRPAVA
jgi:hypothetical protein